MLQVLVVRRDDAVTAVLHETAQESLSQRTTDLWFRAAAELIDQQEAARPGLAHHRLHVQQVRRISRQVILYALLIAHIEEYAVEHSHLGTFVRRNGHTALHHILQEPHRFQTDRFSARIRSGNEQNATALRQTHVKRHDFAVVTQE